MTQELPKGIKILAAARTIRWIGWGLGESLIPIFIATFSNSFAQMGLFSSAADIVSLLSLPTIGLWADRVSAKKLILASLMFYPLVGISYFLAGVFSVAVFVVFARAINGFTWALENVGMETYYRRYAHRGKIATSFGYLDAWSNAGWLAAALVGMYLVSFMPIYYLLLGISPFALIAYLIALKVPKDLPHNNSPARTKIHFLKQYAIVITEWLSWNKHLRFLALLVLLSSLIGALTDFFIPIDAYISGANLSMVAFLTVAGTLPSLMAFHLGRLADAYNKSSLVSAGFLISSLVICGIVVFPHYWSKLLGVFVLGIVSALFNVAKASLITTLGPAYSYGTRGSAFESIATLGDIIMPLMIGVGLDIMGFSWLLYICSGLTICLSATYYLRRYTDTSLYDRIADPI